MKKIPLTKGFVALVDDEDFEMLSRFNWFAWKHRNTFYAVRGAAIDGSNRRTVLYMHRVIMEATEGEQIDHWDNDGLNNTRKNLRRATDSQNRFNSKKRKDNSTGLKGVGRFGNRFRARIKAGGVEHSLGYFDTAEEAHAAYCAAAPKHHGEFARTR